MRFFPLPRFPQAQRRPIEQHVLHVVARIQRQASYRRRAKPGDMSAPYQHRVNWRLAPKVVARPRINPTLRMASASTLPTSRVGGEKRDRPCPKRQQGGSKLPATACRPRNSELGLGGDPKPRHHQVKTKVWPNELPATVLRQTVGQRGRSEE